MTDISGKTANWRIYGGGGLAVGGVLLLIVGFILSSAPMVGLWLTVLAYVVLAVGVALVAYGETGSNGAVGNLAWGKAGLFAAAAGFALYAIALFLVLALTVAVPDFVLYLAVILVAVGLVVGAIAIAQKDVAHGVAKYILFLPAVIAVLWLIGVLAVAELRADWVSTALAVSLLVTGVAYVLNGRLGK